jgi:AcrR family transcriptional regulator
MRRLAQQLGVEAMSLYHWFPRKDSILTAMLDSVYDEVELPLAGEAWRPALRVTAVSAYRTLLKHGWAAPMMDSLDHISVARLRWMDHVLGVLREAGFSAQLIDLSYHVLDSHITGFVLWVLPFRKIERERPNFADDFQKNYPLTDMPDLADHVAYHLAPSANPVSPFEFGLDLILDGLEQQLAASATR